jgi:hypothetical protein
MARPRKPEDPKAFPTPCARCGGHHVLCVTWSDDRLCNYCRLAAIRTTGACMCGHKEPCLAGRTDARPVGPAPGSASTSTANAAETRSSSTATVRANWHS